MKRLLLHARSYERISEQLAGLSDQLSVATMADDGVLRLDGREVSPEEAAVDAAWTNADAFFSPAVRAFMAAVLKSPKLAWVQTGSAGVEAPVFSAIVNKGAVLTTTHVQAVGIADYVLWGVLDHWQRGPERRAAQAEARWEKLSFREIRDSHWLIVGFGAIGQETAARARAFGGRVTGVRRSAGGHPLADAMTSDWRAALPEADVVVLSLPLNRDTARMAGAEAFAAMKPGSILVNVGRGGLVDEPALLAALDRGTPEHAVLDVTDVEPLPPQSPLWRHPRVTLTGHTSGLGSGVTARADQVFLANLRRWIAGEPLEGIMPAAEVLASAVR